MKKNIVFSIALLFATQGIIAEQAEAPAAATQKQVDDLKKFSNSRFNQIKDLIAELKEQQSAKPEKEKNHPCADFTRGEPGSVVAKLVLDWYCLLSGAKAEKGSDQAMSISYSFFNMLVQHHAKRLHSHPVFKWLASNWTSLGIAGTFYVLKATIFKNMTDEQMLHYMLVALYGQGAAAIAVAELGLDQEFQI